MFSWSMPTEEFTIDRLLATVDNHFDSSFLKDEHIERYESDDELYPDPPPSPPVSGRNQDSLRKKLISLVRERKIKLVFQKLDEKRRAVLEYEKTKCVAVQFHSYVVLLGSFFKWRNYAKSRKSFLASRRNLFRKMLLKWKSHAEESHHKSIATNQILTTIGILRNRALALTIDRLKNRCQRKVRIRKILGFWRTITLSGLQKRRGHEARRIARAKWLCLNEWNNHVIVSRFQNKIQWGILCNVLEGWRMITEGNLISRELKMRQAESYDEERSFRKLSRIFSSIVSFHPSTTYLLECIEPIPIISIYFVSKREYCFKKQQYRAGFIHLNSRYKNNLKLLAIKQLVTYLNQMRRFRLVIFKAIKGQVWFRWKQVISQTMQNEAILAKIVLNRWNLLAVAVSERRSLKRMANSHWVYRRCRAVCKCWLSIVTRRIKLSSRSLKPSLTMDNMNFKQINICSSLKSMRGGHSSCNHFDRLNYDIMSNRKHIHLNRSRRYMFDAGRWSSKKEMKQYRMISGDRHNSGIVFNHNISDYNPKVERTRPRTFASRIKTYNATFSRNEHTNHYSNEVVNRLKDTINCTAPKVQRPEWVEKALAERERQDEETHGFRNKVCPKVLGLEHQMTSAIRNPFPNCCAEAKSYAGIEYEFKSQVKSGRSQTQHFEEPKTYCTSDSKH